MNLLEKATKEIHDIIAAIGPKFREQDKKEIFELCEHDEHEIAFETLCEQLYEFNVPISEEIFERIRKLGNVLHIDPHYGEFLKTLIQ